MSQAETCDSTQGPKLSYKDGLYTSRPHETVLETIERHGGQIDSSCRSGVCQSCLVKSRKGKVSPSAQKGLKESLKAQGYFLACMQKAEEDMEIEAASEIIGEKIAVEISKLSSLGANVCRVTFKRPPGFSFESGQFLTFTHPEGYSRSYSIASLSTNSESFEIHVRKVPQGKMSSWFHQTAAAGDSLLVSSPRGDCYYAPHLRDETLILVGTGTGIAPLFAVAQEALLQKHRGSILVFDGGLDESRLYLKEDFKKLAFQNPGLVYKPCVLKGEELSDPSIEVGDLTQIVLREAKAQSKAVFFLCGDPGLVQSLKKKLFLAGASLSKIFADPFVNPLSP